jgi:hypothetical protein
VCIGSKHTVVTTVAPEITRLSPRNGFTVSFVLLCLQNLPDVPTGGSRKTARRWI